MRAAEVRRRLLGASLMAAGLVMASVPAASADPAAGPTTDAPPVAADQPQPAPPLDPTLANNVSGDGGSGVLDACKQFGAAINFAASNYEDFAYATAGNGNFVNYNDPSVVNSNQLGRTALREAASAAMDASNMPGVPPEVSAPMRSWSLHATKLVLIMGLRGGGDSLNNTANDMNTDAHDAQMACALQGAPA